MIVTSTLVVPSAFTEEAAGTTVEYVVATAAGATVIEDEATVLDPVFSVAVRTRLSALVWVMLLNVATPDAAVRVSVPPKEPEVPVVADKVTVVAEFEVIVLP